MRPICAILCAVLLLPATVISGSGVEAAPPLAPRASPPPVARPGAGAAGAVDHAAVSERLGALLRLAAADGLVTAPDGAEPALGRAAIVSSDMPALNRGGEADEPVDPPPTVSGRPVDCLAVASRGARAAVPPASPAEDAVGEAELKHSFGPEAVAALRTTAGGDAEPARLGSVAVNAEHRPIFSDVLPRCDLVRRTLDLLAAVYGAAGSTVDLMEWRRFAASVLDEPAAVRSSVIRRLSAFLILQGNLEPLGALVTLSVSGSDGSTGEGFDELISAHLDHQAGNTTRALSRLLALARHHSEPGAIAAISSARLASQSPDELAPDAWARHVDLLGAIALENAGAPLGSAAADAEARLIAALHGSAAALSSLAAAAERGTLPQAALTRAAERLVALDAADRPEAPSLPVWYLERPQDFAAVSETGALRDLLARTAGPAGFDASLFPTGGNDAAEAGSPTAGGLTPAAPADPRASGWRALTSDAGASRSRPTMGEPARSGDDAPPGPEIAGAPPATPNTTSHAAPVPVDPSLDGLVGEIMNLLVETDRVLQDFERRLPDG